MREIRSFPAKITEIENVLSWVRASASICGFLDKEIKRIELSVEEVIVNIFHYSGLKETDSIELDVRTNEAFLEIMIKDTGVAFDPTKMNHVPDVTASLDDRVIGGLGIYLMKRFIDEISYKREGSFNILTLKKSVS